MFKVMRSRECETTIVWVDFKESLKVAHETGSLPLDDDETSAHKSSLIMVATIIWKSDI